jgi:hypothetical protein
MNAAFAFLVVSAGFLHADANQTHKEELKEHQRRTAALEQKGSALPDDHYLSKRYVRLIEEAKEWQGKTAAIVDRSEYAEDVEAMLRHSREATHRLGMLELRTRIVKRALERGEPEPGYGVLATSGLERIVDAEVPGVPVRKSITLDAAAGETVSCRILVIAFDRGISKPTYPTSFQFVVPEPLVNEDGVEIPAAMVTANIEDETPTDDQRIMLSDLDSGRGLQRTDYLTGAAQDCLIGAGTHNYVHFWQADTAHGIRLYVKIPAGQAPGAYRGNVRVWPITEDYPAFVEIVANVHDTEKVPAPELGLMGGFNVGAYLYCTALRNNRKVEELDREAEIKRHIESLARMGIDARPQDAVEPRDDYLYIPDGPDGPLAMTSSPLLARLCAWQAWAEGKKGVQVATVHDWTDSWRYKDLWPSWRQARGYNNYTRDHHRIGSLFYATNHKSLRLLMLQEGFQDVAWLGELEARVLTGGGGKLQEMRSILARARELARTPDGATPAALLAIRRDVLTMLSR